MIPSVPTTTSRAGKLARTAVPIFQSHPSGRTTGARACPVRPSRLCRCHCPVSSLICCSNSCLSALFLYFGDALIVIPGGEVQESPNEYHRGQDQRPCSS